MTWLRIVLVTAGTTAVALVALWPRPTQAEEVPDFDRVGEFDEEGMKFGNVVVNGALVADGHVPSGWALVRTFENKSDQAERVTVEERIQRTETMPEARVDGTAVTISLHNQSISLAPHEKRKIGIALPPAIGQQITAGLKAKAWAEQARERALAAERWGSPDLDRTYMTFQVEYLKALPPGATAEVHSNEGRTGPARMPGPGMAAAPTVVGDAL